MPKKYEQKNPYFKNSRLSIEDTKDVILLFLRGMSASVTAKVLSVSEATVHPIYKRLRKVISASGFYMGFYRGIDDAYDQLGRMFWEIIDRVMSVENAELLSCIYRCRMDLPPLSIRKKLKDNAENFDEITNTRMACHSCCMKLSEFTPIVSTTEVRMRELFQPYYEIKEESSELMALWVEILNYLASYRNIDETQVRDYILQGAVSRFLKRCEMRVKNNIAWGYEVHELFLENKQKEELAQGYVYHTRMDEWAIGYTLTYLEKNPMGKI